MEIKFLNGQFWIKGKDVLLLLGLPRKKTEGDIILAPGLDEASIKIINGKNRPEPFFISAPGEYEVSGVDISGTGDGLWIIQFEGWKICFLTNAENFPSDKKIDSLGGIDNFLISSDLDEKAVNTSVELAKKISPSTVVLSDSSRWKSLFLDKVDREDLNPQESITFKRGEDLSGETNFVLLTSG